ncbi:hypothetical protein B6259_00650 [Ruminococcaceae bacterium CPB6]|nr:hypothetical protein B6259_00650 [Ruminococcaceae bacterium CPB6]
MQMEKERNMETDNILNKLQLLHGLQADEAEKYRPLAQEAVDRLENCRRKDGGDSLLETAAAALVHLQLTLTEPAGSFTAGDVHGDNTQERAAAKELWKESLAAAAPYLRDERFIFRSVP